MFTLANWCCVSGSLNQGQETVTPYGGSTTIINSPNMFIYGSPNDTVSQITTAGYFNPVLTELSVNDWIIGNGTDGSFLLYVSDISGGVVTVSFIIDAHGPYLLKAANLSDVSNTETSFANLGLGSGQAVTLDDADFPGGIHTLINPCPNYIFVSCVTPGNILRLPPAQGMGSFSLSEGPYIQVSSGFQSVDIETNLGISQATLDAVSLFNFVLSDKSTIDGSWEQIGRVSFILPPSGIPLSGPVRFTSVDGSVNIINNNGNLDFSIQTTPDFNIIDDNSSSGSFFPVWTKGNSGAQQAFVSSTELQWNPSTALLTLNGLFNLGNTPTSNAVRFNLIGPDSDVLGPHIQSYTNNDLDFPVFQLLNWTHNNISLGFDAFLNASNWISSFATSNFQIYKFNDVLQFNASGGNSVGSPVSWHTAIYIDNGGTPHLPNGGQLYSNVFLLNADTLYNGQFLGYNVLSNDLSAYIITIDNTYYSGNADDSFTVQTQVNNTVTIRPTSGATINSSTSDIVLEPNTLATLRLANPISKNWLLIEQQSTTQTPVAFSAYASSPQNNVTGAGTIYTVQFDTQAGGPSPDYNNGTGIFTAPVDGFYQFSTGINVFGIDSGMTALKLSLLLNGTQVYVIAGNNPFAGKDTSGDYTATGAVTVPMSAGDTANITLEIDGGGGDTAGIYSSSNPIFAFFSGTLIQASSSVGSSSTLDISDDNVTNAVMYPVWVSGNSGPQSPFVSSNIFQFNPGAGPTITSAPTFLIASSGLVYSGTSTSTSGSVNEAGYLLSRGDDGNGYAQVHYQTANADLWATGLRAADQNYHIFNQGLDADVLFIDTSGNVTVNTLTPSNLVATDGSNKLISVPYSSVGTLQDVYNNGSPTTKGTIQLTTDNLNPMVTYSTPFGVTQLHQIYLNAVDPNAHFQPPWRLEYRAATAPSTSFAVYCAAEAQVQDPTDSAQSGSYNVYVASAGTVTNALTVDGQNQVISSPWDVVSNNIPAGFSYTNTSYTPRIGDGINDFVTSTAVASWTKIGNMNMVQGQIVWTSKGSATSGTIIHVSLPSALGTSNPRVTGIIGYLTGLNYSVPLAIYATASFDYCVIGRTNGSGGFNNFVVSDFATSGEIQFSIFYRDN